MGGRMVKVFSVVVVALSSLVVVGSDRTSSVGASDASFGTLTPARLFETRTGEPTFDRRDQGVGRRHAGQITQIQIAGRANIPTNAVAAIVNATAINPDGPGFVTVYPCGHNRPGSSTLNYTAGTIVANGTTVALGTGGRICVYTHRAMDFILDVTGYFPAGSSFGTLTPARLFETRTGEPTFDRRDQGVGRRHAGQITQIQIAGRANIPTNAVAAIVNATAINPDGPGFVTVYPCGHNRPGSSTLNYTAGTIVANGTTVALGTGGRICVYTHRAMDFILDVTGYFPAGSSTPTPSPAPWTGCEGVTQIAAPDCAALTALYTATKGSGWVTKTGWLTNNTPCSWHGVTCSARRVTQLNLFENNLAGPIPAQIGNLTALTSLRLGRNQLTGAIPAQIGNLVNLEVLYLPRNRLTGPIPAALGNLTKLENLHLGLNQLTGTIPANISSKLTNLQYLNLFDNQLDGQIPTHLSSLQNLVGLYLGENNLSGPIPVELTHLTNLELLHLGGNRLESIPPEIRNLSNLKFLFLQENQFSGQLPSEISDLTNLEVLLLRGNECLTADGPTEDFVAAFDENWNDGC
jgi:hypothetical protein